MESISSNILPNLKGAADLKAKDVALKEGGETHRNEEAWKMAQKFEASFISQMLTYSGFAKALTASGGEDVAGFAQFYMESIAEDITEQGGFGLAEEIYSNIEKKGRGNGNLGRM